LLKKKTLSLGHLKIGYRDWFGACLLVGRGFGNWNSCDSRIDTNNSKEPPLRVKVL
jgi:hypothetical protein